MFPFFRNNKQKTENHLIHLVHKQIKAWQRASRKMAWGITREEFRRIESPPQLTEDDRLDGFIGPILSYGFGKDGYGNSNSVLSGKLAWAYARKRLKGKTWQCQYIDFDKDVSGGVKML